MRQGWLCLMLVGASLQFAESADAAPPRRSRSVVYVIEPVSVTKTQWSPDSPTPPSANPAVSTDNGSTPAAMSPQGQNSGGNQSQSSAGMDMSGSMSPAASYSFRPTAQQLQNASGSYQFSNTGLSTGATIANNNYFGSQFNTWNNLTPVSSTLNSTQLFNRTQPDINAGIYFSPNTYFGSSNNQWNNLWTSSATPNYLGGYIYQP